MDVLPHFWELDELIQAIYQGFHRFVVLSDVSESFWTVYVGLKGPEGRWWRGSWSERDITQFIGSNRNSQVLESFAHNLAEAFVKGELCIRDWTPDLGATISLTLGPTLKRPVHVPLVELSPKEAASHATAIFSAIALQAQSRKCRLHPPAFSAQTTGPSHASGVSDRLQRWFKHKVSLEATRPISAPKKAQASEGMTPVQVEDSDDAARRKIKSLEAELAHVKAAKKVPSPSPASDLKAVPSASARRPKGASLANPHKKARKYQAVEFESDGD